MTGHLRHKKQTYFRAGLAAFVLLLWLSPMSDLHAAAEGEVSLMVSYSKTDYGNNSYSKSKRYTAGAAINLTPVTQIELSYTNTDTFLNYDPIQTVETNEQVLSLSVIQSLVPPEFIFQPYGKAGAAQYNRRRRGTTYGVPDREILTKDPSAVLGAGVRIFLLRQFSLKIEAVTYLPNLEFGSADDNFGVQGGASWRF